VRGTQTPSSPCLFEWHFRALLKAKRRASDKPRPKKGKDRGKGAVGTDNDERPEDPALTDGYVGGPSVDVAHDNDGAQILADAEREASETLAGMWQAGLLEKPELEGR
jgi:hypothetical protein